MACRLELLGVALAVLALLGHGSAEACGLSSGPGVDVHGHIGFLGLMPRGGGEERRAMADEMSSLLLLGMDAADLAVAPTRLISPAGKLAHEAGGIVNRCAGFGMLECGDRDAGMPPLCLRDLSHCASSSSSILPSSTALSAFNATLLRALDRGGKSVASVEVPKGAVRPITPGGAVSVKIEPVSLQVAALPNRAGPVMNVTFVDQVTGQPITNTVDDVLMCFDVSHHDGPITSLRLVHYDEIGKEWGSAAEPAVWRDARCGEHQVIGRARQFSSYTVVSDQFVEWWDGGNNMWIFIYVGSAILACCCGCCVCCLCGVTQTTILAVIIAFSGTITTVLSSMCCCSNICSCLNSTWIGSLFGCLIKKKKGSKKNQVADDSRLGSADYAIEYEWGKNGVSDYENDGRPSLKGARDMLDVEISDL